MFLTAVSMLVACLITCHFYTRRPRYLIAAVGIIVLQAMHILISKGGL